MSAGVAIGIDVGTSGVRAALADRDANPLMSFASAPLPTPKAEGAAIRQDPELWWRATVQALAALRAQADLSEVAGLAVDGTSGTLLVCDGEGRPLSQGYMYNDASCTEQAARIKAVAPAGSGAIGATSGLAKLLALQATPGAVHALHQADWIAGRLSGSFGFSDANNALKTGYDPVAGEWPAWLDGLGVDRALLPKVREPGAPVGRVSAAAARETGLPEGCRIAAGTTDGCAAFLATGASQPGDAVTSLGSTLVVKLLSDDPVFDAASGVYSHKLAGAWLAGGASNAGGAVIDRFFTPERLAELEPKLDPNSPTGLGYYPLVKPGERFPVNDPDLPPKLEPRPDDDAKFLQGLYEGLAAIEALAYRRLAEAGAPRLASVRTVGGGAKSRAFKEIRRRALGVAMADPVSTEAALGTARLALKALERA